MRKKSITRRSEMTTLRDCVIELKAKLENGLSEKIVELDKRVQENSVDIASLKTKIESIERELMILRRLFETARAWFFTSLFTVLFNVLMFIFNYLLSKR